MLLLNLFLLIIFTSHISSPLTSKSTSQKIAVRPASASLDILHPSLIPTHNCSESVDCPPVHLSPTSHPTLFPTDPVISPTESFDAPIPAEVIENPTHPTKTSEPSAVPDKPTPKNPTTLIPSPTQKPVQESVPNTTSQDILKMVNDYRLQHQKSALSETSPLCKLALKRAKEASLDFSHDGFNPAVIDFGYTSVAENLWQGNPFSLTKMINSWDLSPGHQENLLKNWQHGCGQRYQDTVAFIFLNP